jgi:hypothetical protein
VPRVLRPWILPWMLVLTASDFRVLSRWSNPLSHPDVSTWTCALLPWVSASVRRLDSSQQKLELASDGVSRRYRPSCSCLCVSS